MPPLSPRVAGAVCGAILLFIASGCGESAPAHSDAPLQRLALRPAGDWRDLPASAGLVRTLRPPQSLASWTVDGARRAFVGSIGNAIGEAGREPSTGEGRAVGLVLLDGVSGERVVHIPGTFDPNRFDRVQVHFRMHAGARVHVAGWRDGAELSKSSVQVAPRADEATSLEFFLPRNQTVAGAPFDELRIVFGEEGGTVQLLRVDLESGGALAGMPLVGRDDPQLLLLSDEGRLGWAVPTGRTTQTQIPAVAASEGRDESYLVFSYGVPRSQAMAAQDRLQLVVHLENGREKERHEFGLGKHGGTWQEAAIPLKDHSLKSIDVRFEILTDEGLDLSGYLSEPQWIRKMERPVQHVLLITSDTHRGDHLGAAEGRVNIATPILDGLAKEGTLFERCFTTTNVTLPSHAALFTGVHPRDTGILDNRTALSEEAPTLAEAFSEAGYATWAAVSTRFLSDRISGLGQGFERYAETTVGRRPAAETIARLERWLEVVPDRPTFCWLHLFDAHSPYEPPGEYREASLRGLPDERSTAAHLARGRALYRGEISYLDAKLEVLLGFHEGGLTAFTADHGEALGAHGIVFQHVELYPDTTHVPLILRGPGVGVGERVNGYARHVDLGRTVLDLAGLGGVAFPGESLLEGVGDEVEGRVGRMQFAIAGEATSASVIDPERGLLLVLHLVDHVVLGDDAPRYERHQVELFDLERDAEARVDLMVGSEGVEMAAGLRARLLEWLGDGRDLGWARSAEMDEVTRESLVDLGYVGGGDAPSGRREVQGVDADCECGWCEVFAGG